MTYKIGTRVKKVKSYPNAATSTTNLGLTGIVATLSAAIHARERSNCDMAVRVDTI